MNAKVVEKLPSAERPSIGDKDLDYAKEFWTVGNAIAGFSIVQTLWFFTVVAPGHDAISKGVNESHVIAGWATLVVTLLYLLGVGFAHSAHYKIIDRYISPEPFRRYLWGFWIIRYGIVALTGILVSIVCFNFHLAPP
jgi:hypothetical protein